ncbi:MAG: hypothetical protein IPK82_32470 [Polyangiaceae bacterium]|nr:hypothetical protein [Polyangiaceae bacterium]
MAAYTLTFTHDVYTLCASLTPYAAAYVALKTEVFAGETVRIRKKHVREYLSRLSQSSPSIERGAAESGRMPFPQSLVALRTNVSFSLFKEALAHAISDHLHGAFDGLTPTLKENLIGALRLLSVTFEWDDPTRNPPTHPDATVPSEWVTEPWQRTIFLLTRAMDNSPLALCDAVGFSHRDGVPRLRGGSRLPIEQRWRKLIRRLTGAFKTTDLTTMRRIELRPISKIRALGRSSLGSDCSSNAVPFRALSPHHVYYTLFENNQLIEGYVTVYEAWAEHLGSKLPVLCLETVNVPTHALDSALPDLIAVFEAIAEIRGLHPHLVVITDIGTYNYRSMPILQRMRRFRRGKPVELTPADPPLWNVYAATSPDAYKYSAFVGHAQSGIRLLAPQETDRPLHPDTLAEIARIKALPRTQLVGTTLRNGKMVGFISGLPTVPA